jgi:hypothetical protein
MPIDDIFFPTYDSEPRRSPPFPKLELANGTIEHQKRQCGRSGLETGRSAIRTVCRSGTGHPCVRSIPDFLRDLLAKHVELTQESTCNRFRPPLYIDKGLRPIEPSTIDTINCTYRFYLMH